MTKIDITIEVPDELYNAGAVELFSKNFGWTEKITETNEEGIETEVDNPISALDFGVMQIQNYLYQHAKRQYVKERTVIADKEFSSLTDVANQKISSLTQ